MPSIETNLRRELAQAGFSSSAIDAVWPKWWSADAENSLSASTELKYTVAKRLGLSPESLFEGPLRFVWRDDAKFKYLGTESDQDRWILSSFGTAVGRSLIQSTHPPPFSAEISAESLRDAILSNNPYVSLDTLLASCWSMGIPVIYLSVFPLGAKRMHAMTVRLGDRYAILLGRVSEYAARVAYDLAHEIGHVLLEHLEDSSALLELSDPLVRSELDRDREEFDADSFALTLLTGEERPTVLPDRDDFSATELAAAAIKAGGWMRIDPGMLALCLGHATGSWEKAFGALKLIPPHAQDLKRRVNHVARSQLRLAEITLGTRDYLESILGDE